VPRIAEPDPAWETFAAAEPWFAVLTDAKYLRRNLDVAAENEFFKTGGDYVRHVLHVIHRNVDPDLLPVTILEYGCGAGRLAIPFAQFARSVTAVDRSPAMLAAARENAARRDVANIEFLSASEFEERDQQFDLVNCHLVFQRLPHREAIDLLRMLLARVAPGGAGIFHFPYRTRAGIAMKAERWLREHVPPVNAAANVLRRKPARQPFIATHTFDLNQILTIVQESGFNDPHLVFATHGEVDGVVVYAQRSRMGERASRPQSPGVSPGDEQQDKDFIDVRKLIAETNIDDLNRTAEAYFARLDNWDDHLAKPFSRVADAAPILINLGVLLQGLRFRPGQTIVDYGGGSGWLARFLTQLGAKSIVLDVSPTALNIARELYSRMPVIGDRPAPEFLVYDGHRIDLPDASVDRIVSFDAFHHAPNPGEVLAEFARILKPGGVAAFAEPGPNHSRTPQSQFEMRTFRVVENDVYIHQIWRDAQQVGFDDLKLAAFNIPPFHVSVDEYEDLLAGGETFTRWGELTRAHLGNVRNFFLTKRGTEALDSRDAGALAATLSATLETTPRAGEPIALRLTVTNRGRARWLPSDERIGGVSIGGHLFDGDGNLINFLYHWQSLPKALESGETLTFTFTTAPLAAGRYRLDLDCVSNQVAWFNQLGSKTATVELTI
jgi:ubiquinone/menaquinone biosynthesis C-methylase UbiE